MSRGSEGGLLGKLFVQPIICLCFRYECFSVLVFLVETFYSVLGGPSAFSHHLVVSVLVYVLLPSNILL